MLITNVNQSDFPSYTKLQRCSRTNKKNLHSNKKKRKELPNFPVKKNPEKTRYRQSRCKIYVTVFPLFGKGGKRCKYTPRGTLPDQNFETIDAILHFDEAAMLSAISG